MKQRGSTESKEGNLYKLKTCLVKLIKKGISQKYINMKDNIGISRDAIDVMQLIKNIRKNFM